MDGLEGLNGAFAEQGTKASGYEEKGPYHCEDCVHQNGAQCYHPVVMADPERAKHKAEDGSVKVNLEKGCCKYVKQE